MPAPPRLSPRFYTVAFAVSAAAASTALSYFLFAPSPLPAPETITSELVGSMSQSAGDYLAGIEDNSERGQLRKLCISLDTSLTAVMKQAAVATPVTITYDPAADQQRTYPNGTCIINVQDKYATGYSDATQLDSPDEIQDLRTKIFMLLPPDDIIRLAKLPQAQTHPQP